MLILPLDQIEGYVRELNDNMERINPALALSRCQCEWMSIVLTGIVVTNRLSWATFERRSLGAFSQERLRWMFNLGKIAWSWLLQASTQLVITSYGLTEGVLVTDDSEKKRSKKTTKIPGTHKIKHKASGGYINGQELVFLVLVTGQITFPVGFRFYQPDPEMTQWRKENKKLKNDGIPPDQRPPKPALNPAYPTKQVLAAEMVEDFKKSFPSIKIKSLLADALYGDGNFMDQTEELLNGSQIISQLRNNQLIFSRGKWVNLKTYFARQSGVEREIIIRGGSKKIITVQAARLLVKAHGKKRFIVAIKYKNEDEYRFLVASDLSWRHEDIIRTFTLRWLIEVFIEDWKQHEGWNRMTKHQGEEGSMRGVILSLLCDHMLLLHPEQLARLKNKQPGMSTGCLIEHIKMNALIKVVYEVVKAKNPKESFDKFAAQLKRCLPERNSTKHMVGKELGRMEPTPSLKYKKAS